MPAVSQAQQRLMAMAEHNPGAISEKNRGVLDMTHSQLHDFAATNRKDLPPRAPQGHIARRALLGGMRGY